MKGTCSEKPIENTAYHEAGHAVTAQRYGRYVDEVILNPADEDARGRCNIIGRRGDFSDGVILLAGRDAERHFDSNPDHDNFGYCMDILEAEEIAGIDDEESDDFDRLYPIMEEKSKDLVVKNWRQIEAVADALLRFKRITGDLVRDIIDKIDAEEDYRTGWEWNWHESLQGEAA